MKIKFNSSGGFANLELSYQADTKRISPELAQELVNLVSESKIFELDTSNLGMGEDIPPDVFSYQFSIEDENREVSLECNDITVPVSLRPLFARLQELALEQKRRKL